MFFKNKKLIGVDIGSHSIKVAELNVSKKSANLVSFGILQTPPESLSANGEVIDSGALSQTLSQLVSEIKSKRKNAAIGLWGSTVIVKRISVPKMEKELLGEQIRWEAEQYVPYDINEVNLAFHILQETGPETMDVLLVAAVQENIFQHAEVISLAGLNCQVADVQGFALANCFELNYGLPAESILLLNVGANITNFVVVDQGQVVFSRDLPIGGLTYTSELAKALSMSPEEAESIKLSVSSGQPAPDEAANVIQMTHDLVLDEIKNSLDFFYNTTVGQKDLVQCFYTGGGVLVSGWAEAIEKLLPSSPLDPFRQVGVSDKKFSQEFASQIKNFAALSVGLGIRQEGDDD